MGSQLRWLERTPDKREVDGSIPFEPTNSEFEFVRIFQMIILKEIVMELVHYSTLKNIQIYQKR